MLAKRLSKRNRLKHKALALCIKRTSFEMFPCSFCEKNNAKCVVSNKENSDYCSEYVFHKAKCDVKGILVSE
jgi:hypothetical protein